ncbi:MAG: hypothetical protein ABIH42_09795, partial [Planctomycetota bacterium]
IPVYGLNGLLEIKKDYIGFKTDYIVNNTHGASTGTIVGAHGEKKVNIVTTIEEVPLNKAFRDALSERDQQTWDDFSPEGKTDVSVIYSRDETEDNHPNVTVKVQFTGEASAEYHEFKYRLERLHGTFEINPDGVFLKNITSTEGARTVTIEGAILREGPNRGTNVLIRGTDFPITDKLLSALHERERDTIDAISPHGKTDFLVEIKSPSAGEPAKVTVEIFPNAKASIHPCDFPVLLNSITGKIVIIPGSGVMLQKIQGKIGNGDIFVKDTTIGKPGAKELKIECLLKSIPVNDSLMSAVSYASKSDFFFLQLDGLADAELLLHKNSPEEKMNFLCNLNLRDLSAVYKGIPLKITGLNGYLEVSPQGLRIRSLRGKAESGTALIWGEVLKGRKSTERASDNNINVEDEKTSLRLNIELHKIPLNETLRNALTTELRDVYDLFSPSGYATIAVKIVNTEGRITSFIDLKLENSSIKYKDFPFRLSGLYGRVKIAPSLSTIQLEDITASNPALKLSGFVKDIDSDKKIELNINLDKFLLTPEFRDSLPGGLGAIAKTLSLKGVISANVNLKVEEDTFKKTHIRYSAEISPENCSLSAGIPFTEVTGKVTLEGEILQNGEHKLYVGRLQISKFTAAKRRVQWLSAKIELEKDKIKIAPITGKIAGGNLEGEIVITTSHETGYSGKFSVTNANIRDAVEDIFSKKIESATGTARAWCEFSGKGSGESGISGKGGIKFKDANLVEVPVFSSLIKYLSGGVVLQTNFEDGKAGFIIKNKHFYFDTIFFKSTILNLEGVGKLRFDGKIDLTFNVEIVKKLFPVPLVKEILQFVQNNIVQLRVTGDFQTVSIAPQPFGPLGDIFKKLIEESEK